MPPGGSWAGIEPSSRLRLQKRDCSPGLDSLTFSREDPVINNKASAAVTSITPPPASTPTPVVSMPAREGVRMLMVYSPGETEGMFADMHALSREQLMDAKLTRAIAAKHNTVMIEKEPDGKGKGTVLG